MQKKSSPFLRIEDHFGEVARIPVITVFENRLPDAPRFTFAIPTFKRVETLRETLESVFNQDIAEPYEIIVSDNNPKRDDETERLMAEFAGVPNLTYIKNSQNLGMTGNWNRLPLLTRGEYIVLLHDDDCVAPFFLCSASALLEKHPDADLLQFTKINEKAFEFRQSELYARRIRFYDNIVENVTRAPTGTVYRRDTLVKLGGWNGDFYPSQDYCFDTLLLYHGYKAYKSPLKATYYRLAINLSLKKETMIGWVKIGSAIRDDLLKHIGFPAFLRHYLKFYDDLHLVALLQTPADPPSNLTVPIGRTNYYLKRGAGYLARKYAHFLSFFAHLTD